MKLTTKIVVEGISNDVRLDEQNAAGVKIFSVWRGPDEVGHFRLLPSGEAQGYDLFAVNGPTQITDLEIEQIIEETRRTKWWDA